MAVVPGTVFAYPENADRFYAIIEGRLKVPVIAENEHGIAYDDGSDDGSTRISIIPRAPISSLAVLDIGNALRWLGLLQLVRAVPRALDWGPRDGFRVEIPVHPPYQRQPWLRMQVTRRPSKPVKAGADDRGYTRDIGHFVETLAMRKRVEVVYADDDFMMYHNLEDEDNARYDAALMGIARHEVVSVLDSAFTDQDWLSMVGGIRQSALRIGVEAYVVRLNVGPPYQHTPWVHVHLLAGGKALPTEPEKQHKHADSGKAGRPDGSPATS